MLGRTLSFLKFKTMLLKYNWMFIINACCFQFLFLINASSQNHLYEIYALKFASLKNKIPVTSIAVGSKSNDSTGVCYMIWLLKSQDGKLILVDAGFTDRSINPNMEYMRPDSILLKMNIAATAITDIIITHPHWDHIGGIDLFPNAKIWMQRNDYNYFVNDAWQENGNNMGFNKADVQKIVNKNLDGKLNLVNGKTEILPGISVQTGSKHTFESQYVITGDQKNKVILASDSSWFYYNIENLLAIPVNHDQKAYIRNLKKMKKMVNDHSRIIPGHDPLVFTKFPLIEEGIAKIQ